MKHKILFRTAGGKSRGKELGLGHVYRTINLAKSLSKYEIFFMIEDFGGVQKLLQENGFKNIQLLQNNISSSIDFQKTKNFIIKNDIDLIIFDKYKISKTYVKKFKNFVKTTVISDLYEINYDADLIINGFVGHENKIFKKNSITYLLGPKYQILDNKFKTSVKKKSILRKQYKKLLITFGGFDENKIIDLILNYFSYNIKSFNIIVVLGPATVYNSNLKQLQKKFSKNLTIIHSTKNMKKLISNCDFGICGGGLTSYEFVTMKKPFAIICQSSHQILTAKKWEELKLGLNLGYPNTKLKSKINTLIQRLVSNQISIGTKYPSFLDGKAGLRISKQIEILLKN